MYLSGVSLTAPLGVATLFKKRVRQSAVSEIPPRVPSQRWTTWPTLSFMLGLRMFVLRAACRLLVGVGSFSTILFHPNPALLILRKCE